jgi:hypothetical protein
LIGFFLFGIRSAKEVLRQEKGGKSGTVWVAPFEDGGKQLFYLTDYFPSPRVEKKETPGPGLLCY